MDIQKAVLDYKNCIPMIEIAKEQGVTRQAVWKALRSYGVDTSKKSGAWRVVRCDMCGEEYRVTRSRYRKSGKKRFCTDTCYHLYLRNNDSVVNRHMQRRARKKVLGVFDLLPNHVVHHEDGNHWNTQWSNLKVFASQSDHIRYHHQKRQGEVTVRPLWDGSNIFLGY